MVNHGVADDNVHYQVYQIAFFNLLFLTKATIEQE